MAPLTPPHFRQRKPLPLPVFSLPPCPLWHPQDAFPWCCSWFVQVQPMSLWVVSVIYCTIPRFGMWMVMWNAALTRRRSYTPPWPPGRLLFPQVSHRDARRLHRPARHYFSAISKHEGGTGQIKSQVGPPSIRNKVHIIMITSRLRKPWGPKSSFASSRLLTYSL